ncbi:MAG: signal peptidase I [Coriobacteriia bacterium]|nr:signal peptidase I [Coriobacteriia bacterium]
MSARFVAMPVAALALVLATHGAVVVTGSSMEPTLSRGDICIYRKTHKVQPGQIVVFERDEDEGLVVHRALTVGLRGEVRSQGDSNDVGDQGVVSADRLRGPVVLAFPTGSLERQ